jgi:hypothetical protein
MKRIITLLTFIFSIGSFTILNGQISSGSNTDTIKIIKDHSILDDRGVDVYRDNKQLSVLQVEYLLSSYPKILRQYQKGRSLRSTGQTMLIGGGIAIVGGVVLMINGVGDKTESYNDYGYYEERREVDGKFVVGYFGVIVGALLIDGGIACTVIGKIKIKQSIRNYNASNQKSEYINPGAIKYNLGLLDNGRLGVRLTF